MKYYDPNTERYETITTNGLAHSQAGWTGAVEYGVLYYLPRGKFLSAVKHQDRGDLATDLRIHAHRPKMVRDIYVGGEPIQRSENVVPKL